MDYDIRAYLALLLFVPLSVVLLVAFRRPLVGIVVVFFTGILFLPERAAFDFPFLPPMDKNGFASMMAFAGALIYERRKLNAVRMLSGVELFFLLIVIGNIGTAMTNGDTLIYGRDLFRGGRVIGEQKILSSIQPYDIISMTIRDVIDILIPYHLGRALIRNGDDLRTFFRVVAMFGLIYVPFILFEARMSPQLHTWVYGFSANSWLHNMRGDGYKATVFLNNGLAVGMFMVVALLCVVALARSRDKIGPIPNAISGFCIWVALALSRNLGANLYAFVAVPISFLTRGRLANWVATVFVLLVLSFPALRATGTFPTHELVSMAEGFSADRAQSLGFRFDNEDILLEKARERMWFGWGGYGRNRIYDDWGKDVSVTDGEWIIRFGSRGLVGFIGSFALLLMPIMAARRTLRRLPPGPDRYALDIFSLTMGLVAIDLLPNGMFTQMPFFIAGALAGAAAGLRAPASPSYGSRR